MNLQVAKNCTPPSRITRLSLTVGVEQMQAVLDAVVRLLALGLLQEKRHSLELHVIELIRR